jgi:antitoxin component of RelBE/YafQ-DinJ toxin-antitoxin module
MTGNDMQKVSLAADAMGMTKSMLMRILLVKGAERILEELGLEIEYVQNDHVDLAQGETLIEQERD